MSPPGSQSGRRRDPRERARRRNGCITLGIDQARRAPLGDRRRGNAPCADRERACSRVRLRADGGMKTGYDVIVASMLGADEFVFGSALLVALGCIYARQCHRTRAPSASPRRTPPCARSLRARPRRPRASWNSSRATSAAVLRHSARARWTKCTAVPICCGAPLRDRYAAIDLSEDHAVPERPVQERRPAASPTHLDTCVPRTTAFRRSGHCRSVRRIAPSARVSRTNSCLPRLGQMRSSRSRSTTAERRVKLRRVPQGGITLDSAGMRMTTWARVWKAGGSSCGASVSRRADRRECVLLRRARR